MLSILAIGFILLGLAFFILGLLKFCIIKQSLVMLHFSILPEFFGFGFVAIGACLMFASVFVAIKILAILFLVFLTMPVASQAMAIIASKNRSGSAQTLNKNDCND